MMAVYDILSTYGVLMTQDHLVQLLTTQQLSDVLAETDVELEFAAVARDREGAEELAL